MMQYLKSKISLINSMLSRTPSNSTSSAISEIDSSISSSISSNVSFTTSTPRRKLSLDSEPSIITQASTASSEISLTRSSSLSISDGQCKCTMTLQGGFCDIQIASEGEMIYSTSWSSISIRVWLGSDFSHVTSFGSDVSARGLLVNGNIICSAHNDHKIRIWQRMRKSGNHKHIATLPSRQDCLISYVLPNSHVKTRRHKKKLKIQHYDAISSLAMDKSGQHLYSGSWDKTVKVWDLTDFRCIESIEAHDDAVNALAVSSDGYLFTGSADCKIKVWKKGLDGKHLLVSSLEKHKSAVNFLLSSDELLYSASGDKTIAVWGREDNVNCMTVSAVLRGHERAVLCLSIKEDVLCSGSADFCIRIWKRSGSAHCCIAVLRDHKSPVKSLFFAKDFTGYRIYSSSLDGNLKAWRVSLSSCELLL